MWIHQVGFQCGGWLLHLSDPPLPATPPGQIYQTGRIFYGIFKSCEANLWRCSTRLEVELSRCTTLKQGASGENSSLFPKDDSRNAKSDKTVLAGRRQQQRRENPILSNQITMFHSPRPHPCCIITLRAELHSFISLNPVQENHLQVTWTSSPGTDPQSTHSLGTTFTQRPTRRADFFLFNLVNVDKTWISL